MKVWIPPRPEVQPKPEQALVRAPVITERQALREEAQRKLRKAKRRYGFPMDAGRES